MKWIGRALTASIFDGLRIPQTLTFKLIVIYQLNKEVESSPQLTANLKLISVSDHEFYEFTNFTNLDVDPY